MGTNLGFSQRRRSLYSGRLKLHYTRGPVRNSADYLATYGKTDGTVSANRMDGSFKTTFEAMIAVKPSRATATHLGTEA